MPKKLLFCIKILLLKLPDSNFAWANTICGNFKFNSNIGLGNNLMQEANKVFGTISGGEFDLAKIDVEGFALQVLKGFGDKLNNFKALQIELEVKQVWSEQSFYQDVVDYLNKFNFIILDEIDLDGIQKDVLFINKKYINGAL
jgi:hypothetical protein